MIQYKNYSIVRLDDYSWQITRTDTKIAERDMKMPKTGEIYRKTGDSYIAETNLGYHSDIGKAFSRIVKDLAGKGCETVKEVAAQVAELRADLADLTKFTKKTNAS